MDARRYLARMGYDGPLTPDHATLAALQRAHLLSIPFDALDCHLGARVTVEPQDAYAKVVERGRGGFCFELNGLFAWLLEEAGFRVTRLAARPVGRDGLAPPYAHLTLLVALERRWLVDVGFGSPFAFAPLDLDVRGDQRSGGRAYRIAEHEDGLVAEEAGAAEPNAYVFTLDPVAQADFAPRCLEFSTDPASSFVRHGPVVQAYEDGWAKVTRSQVSGERDGVPFGRRFADEADWRAELERRFGFRVPAGAAL